MQKRTCFLLVHTVISWCGAPFRYPTPREGGVGTRSGRDGEPSLQGTHRTTLQSMAPNLTEHGCVHSHTTFLALRWTSMWLLSLHTKRYCSRLGGGSHLGSIVTFDAKTRINAAFTDFPFFKDLDKVWIGLSNINPQSGATTTSWFWNDGRLYDDQFSEWVRVRVTLSVTMLLLHLLFPSPAVDTPPHPHTHEHPHTRLGCRCSSLIG